MGAVLVEGPKACGKTETASRVAQTIFRMERDVRAAELLHLAPDELVSYPPPILFDEWQVEPSIWNLVRREVDDRKAKGQFILTGSSTPTDDARRHSGAGRFARLRMRPMSLFESGHSTGEMSLARLLDGDNQSAKTNGLGFKELVSRIVIGGWPELVDANEADGRHWTANYLSNVVEVDVPKIGVRRHPRNMQRLLSSLARNTGTAAKSVDIARDVGGESGPVAASTLTSYLEALERLNLLDDTEAWMPHMRSRTRLRQAPVRYLVDPSLGAAALNVGSEHLIADPEALGFQFESMVMRDLKIYAQALAHQGRVYSWRDANGKEVDAIVDVGHNQWAAFEIKLNPNQAEQAAQNLLDFASKVDTSKHGEPKALAVITSSGYGYQRKDGVHIIPIGTLGP
jgi:predicted AAA+ superfamily ATPase